MKVRGLEATESAVAKWATVLEHRVLWKTKKDFVDALQRNFPWIVPCACLTNRTSNSKAIRL